MKPTHLLDTSVYCQPIRKTPLPSVMYHWNRVGAQRLAISVLADAEILQGILVKESVNLRRAYEFVLRGKFHSYPVDLEVAESYAALYAQTRKRGEPRSTMDLLMAATAQVHGLILATCNFRHFDGIPGVRAEDWTLH